MLRIRVVQSLCTQCEGELLHLYEVCLPVISVTFIERSVCLPFHRLNFALLSLLPCSAVPPPLSLHNSTLSLCDQCCSASLICFHVRLWFPAMTFKPLLLTFVDQFYVLPKFWTCIVTCFSWCTLREAISTAC